MSTRSTGGICCKVGATRQGNHPIGQRVGGKERFGVGVACRAYLYQEGTGAFVGVEPLGAQIDGTA